MRLTAGETSYNIFTPKLIFDFSIIFQVIHGTTGTGRSGIYACIDSQIKRIKKYSDVNVYESVFDVRQNRYDGVKTLDEYIFIHDSVLEWILKKNIKDIDVEYLPQYIENINKSAPDSK